MLEWLTAVPARGDWLPARIWRGLPWAAAQIFFVNGVNGNNPLLTRESTDPTPVTAIFGGTTEIQKEIIARGLGLMSGQVLCEACACGF